MGKMAEVSQFHIISRTFLEGTEENLRDFILNIRFRNKIWTRDLRVERVLFTKSEILLRIFNEVKAMVYIRKGKKCSVSTASPAAWCV
jgi:hypothetical protein